MRLLTHLLFGSLLALLVTTPIAAQSRTTWPSTLILDAATTPASGAAMKPASCPLTFMVFGTTSAGSGSATVVIEVSNVENPSTNADWITAGTVTLTLGTTQTANGFGIDIPWRNVRARVTAISGTTSTVSVRMGA